MGRIQGKVAVITGAASGMGRATALRFAKEGASVVLTDLNSQGGETAVAECAAAGGRAVFQRTDVTSEADIKAAVARAVKEYGRLDIMFNNAGVAGAVGPIEKVASADFDQNYRHTPARGLPRHEVFDPRDAQGGRWLDYLDCVSRGTARRRLSGRIQRGEGGGREPDAGGRDRSRARQDSRQLHLPRRREYATDPSRGPGAEERSEKSWRECSRYRAPASPTDIATMALFLASDDADWISGTAMVVDGGINTGNARFRMAGLPDSGFSGPSFEM